MWTRTICVTDREKIVIFFVIHSLFSGDISSLHSPLLYIADDTIVRSIAVASMVTMYSVQVYYNNNNNNKKGPKDSTISYKNILKVQKTVVTG